jgi:Fe2+ or Zn2+ uptake regulation protein
MFIPALMNMPAPRRTPSSLSAKEIDAVPKSLYINYMSQSSLKTTSCNLEQAELHDTLTQAGLRCTRQREAVLVYLRTAEGHPTAAQVYAAVKEHLPNISLATVYKTLETLVDAGLAAKLPDAGGPARFDCRCDAHYHLRCLQTGEVRDLHTPFDPHLLTKLDPHLVERLRQEGFQVTGHRLELLGYFQEESGEPRA